MLLLQSDFRHQLFSSFVPTLSLFQNSTKEKDFAGRIGSLWSQVANEVAEFGYKAFVQVASHLMANCNFFCPFCLFCLECQKSTKLQTKSYFK
jgi:hypothetical protein